MRDGAVHTLRRLGFGAMVVALLLALVGIERFVTSAEDVAALNEALQNGPLAPVLGTGHVEMATPTSTLYALSLALLCGALGGFWLLRARGLSAARSRGAATA